MKPGQLLRVVGFLVLALLVILGLFALQGRDSQVEVIEPSQRSLVEALAVSGRVRGRMESRLAFEVGGTLEGFEVEEGQVVEAGQILARLESDRLQAQVGQARARVGVAEAQRRLAERKPLPSEFSEVEAEVERAREAAEAALESARQRWKESLVGPRMEQIEQARAARDQALAELAQRERDWLRQRELEAQGAVSRQAQEQAFTAFETARQNHENAQARLAELENGTRPEVLEQARQAVLAAEAELRAAREAGEARLQQLRDRPRVEDVELAQEQVKEAKAALELASQQEGQAVLRAPYDGVVGLKLLRDGDQAGPNTPVLTFSSRPNLEVRVDIDESDLSRIKLGQQAIVSARGFPEQFEVSVGEFAGEIDAVRGTLEVRLWSEDFPDWILPGQTVDVNLLLTPQQERLVLPLTSVRLKGIQTYIAVVSEGRVELREVQLSGPTEEGYLVESGVEPGELVVRYPQEVEDGQRVRTKKVEF